MMRYGVLVFFCLLLAGCFGGATETETGTAMISGKAQLPDGSPAVCALIRLRPIDFVADSSDANRVGAGSWDTVTDAAGRFAFLKIPSGDFAVEALYRESRGVLLRFAVASPSDRQDLAPLVLRNTTNLTGRVRFADSSLAPALVQVPGTGHRAVADSATGLFTLWGMPPGDFSLRVSTALPFFPAKEFDSQVAEAGPASVDIGDLVLDKASKQEFSLANGKLAFAGIDGSNPVIYENDFAANTWDNELVWALASLGRIDLRGTLVTPLQRDTQPAFAQEMARWAREAQVCRQSGMRNIPEPIPGASRKLTLPPSGRWQDIVPESNPGIRLLLAEARRASVEKPLVVVAGGPLTTVANAMLLDPSIADKMVVFGAYNHTLNGKDSLASFLVASQCRLVEWGRDYFWSGGNPSTAAIPTNWLGTQLQAGRDTSSSPLLFFADISAVAFLADNQAWKTARGAKVVSSPLKATIDGQGPFDFIDVPRDANDWAVMDNVFFSVFGDSAVYHPWPVPGALAGVSFREMSGVLVDSVAGEGYIAKGIASGDWMDFSLEAAYEGEYDLVLRFQCDTQAQVLVGGRDSASQADLQLSVGATWGEAQARIHLKAGPQTIRLTTSKGAWKLGQLRLNAGP